MWTDIVKRHTWLQNSDQDGRDADVLNQGSVGVVDFEKPITSIDQLYAQASGLDNVLLRKVICPNLSWPRSYVIDSVIDEF